MEKRSINVILRLAIMILLGSSCTPDPNKDPHCSIVYPEDGAEIQAGNAHRFVVDAYDEDGQINGVVYYINGEQAGSVSTPPYEFFFVPTYEQAGINIIKALVLDNQAGTCSAEISVKVVINLPRVETTAPVRNNENHLITGGILLDDGGSAVVSRGVCWSTEPGPTVSDNHTSDGAGPGKFSSTISGLSPGTTYYIRAYVKNSKGVAYGNEIEYLYITPPYVEVSEITDLTNITASCHAKVLGDGGDSVVARGFCWSVDTAPSVSGDHTILPDGAQSFSSQLKGLHVNTRYHLRAYARNSVGIAYSDEVQFLTQGNITGVVTDERDGQSYRTVKIGDQWWMAENLNIGVFTHSSSISSLKDLKDNIIQKFCYDDNPDLCDSYGGLYIWAEMMQWQLSDNANPGTTQGVCPAGWHLPTDDEWKSLEINLGMSPEEAESSGPRGTYEGNMLRQRAAEPWPDANRIWEDEVDFDALPAGIRLMDGNFDALGAVTSFWSATKAGNGTAWYRHLTGDSGIERGNPSKREGFSVRCVKD